jgi:hypothetical protein
MGKDEVLRTYDDRRNGRYVRADAADFRIDSPNRIFPEDADFPLLTEKQVSADRDGSYPVTDDTALTYEQITALCRRRRNAECYLRSLEQNASSEKLPTKIATNHFFASLCGYVRLEMLKISAFAYRFLRTAKITAFENYCVT